MNKYNAVNYLKRNQIVPFKTKSKMARFYYLQQNVHIMKKKKKKKKKEKKKKKIKKNLRINEKDKINNIIKCLI